MLQRILIIVVALFPVSEVALALMKRSRGQAAQSEDRGSLRLLWIGIAIGLGLGIAAERILWTRISGPLVIIRLVALALLVGGLAIRWTAILTLGRLFTVDVAIHAKHAVVQVGLYRFARHPSYSGLLIAFLGLGVYFGNWIGIIGLLVPIVLVVLNRVAKEERALLASLGDEYAAYCARTKRFIPRLV